VVRWWQPVHLGRISELKWVRLSLIVLEVLNVMVLGHPNDNYIVSSASGISRTFLPILDPRLLNSWFHLLCVFHLGWLEQLILLGSFRWLFKLLSQLLCDNIMLINCSNREHLLLVGNNLHKRCCSWLYDLYRTKTFACSVLIRVLLLHVLRLIPKRFDFNVLSIMISRSLIVYRLWRQTLKRPSYCHLSLLDWDSDSLL